MNITLKKPAPPKGYRLLVGGKDKNLATDLVWMMAIDDLEYEWDSANNPFFDNPRFIYGNGKKYINPLTDDYAIFRCRKI